MKNRVKECRLKAHLSQDELAAKCDLARPTISKIERNECESSDLSKQKIADALGFQIDEVFPGSEKQDASLIDQVRETILGICIVNGKEMVPGLRSGGTATADVVDVKDHKIEGFLIDKLGQRKPFTQVHLVRDGEKIESTVTSRQGRFIFKNVEPGEYVVFSENKVTPIQVSSADETFDFEL